MNFSADKIDMWPRESGLGPSFSEWSQGQPEVSDDPYPPRGDVGRYLAAGFDRVVERATGRVEIELHRERVESLNRSDSWDIGAGDHVYSYDEVLLATGHASDWEGTLSAPAGDQGTVIPRVFPVDEYLSEERVKAGSTVAIRGFALSMIDAALALTEGRGGKFVEGRKPYLLEYQPAGREPSRILPWSRTGHPMLAKPDPALTSLPADLEAATATASARLAAQGEPTARATADAVTDAAVALGGFAADDLRDRLRATLKGTTLPSPDSAAEALERSIALASGAGQPGADWALGHAWRALYPTIVERLGGSSLDDSEWPAFRFLATEMERVAFGPPPVNAAKLLALIEAGIVDLSRVRGGAGIKADFTVDAVIPAPGIINVGHAPLNQLIHDGLLRVAPNRRGVELTPDVTCVGSSGEPSTGLGAVGRPTEDWVIGNDTLNRELHPHPDLWAKRVVARASG